MSTYAKIIADSISEQGDRLTTFEGCLHRYMLPELNTHGVLARNSGSSRARPVAKVIADVREHPALPTTWRREQKGMQGGEHLSDVEVAEAVKIWNEVLDVALSAAEELTALGLHKSNTNRLLEPFGWHTVVITGTSFENFYDQRISDQAQDEIRALAEAMRAAQAESTPRLLLPGQWHLPYVDDDAFAAIEERAGGDPAEFYRLATSVSAARSARVSYLTQDGRRDIDADLTLYERLTTARPAHWSPLEHVATPWPENRQTGTLPFIDLTGQTRHVPLGHLPHTGKLVGWRALRTQVETIQGDITWR